MRIKRSLAILLSVVMFLGMTALPIFAEAEPSTYERIEPKVVAGHLYEVQYNQWNPEKAEAIGHCLAKPKLNFGTGIITLTEEEKQLVKGVLKEYFSVSEDDASSFIDYVTHEYTEQEYLDYISKFVGDHIGDESTLYILSQVYGTAITPAEFVTFLIQLNELGKYYEENPLAVWHDLLENINNLSPYACTSCRSGDIIGRNFDWVYDDVDEFIMRVPATEGRYASVGVATGFFPPEIQDWIKINDILPMLTMDGINEKGVAINVNVVASSDIAAWIGEKDYTLAYTSGTNPNMDDPFDFSKDLCAGFVVREILDHADSAEKAIEILTQEKNIYSIQTQEFHWMISDENATYIVECVDNQLVILKTKEDDEKHQAAMSNFHVTNSQRLTEYDVIKGNDKVSPNYTKLPMGIERYKTVKSGLSDVKDEESMLSNMREVWYKDKIFKKGNERFKSDMNMHSWTDSSGTSHVFTYGDEGIDGSLAARNEAFRVYREEKLPKALEREKNDPEHRRQRLGDDPNGVIQTVHTSIYNLKEQTLTVNVQERKTSFTFALSESFNENRTGITVNGDNVGLGVKCEESDKEWSYDRNTKVLTLNNCAENAYKLEGEDPEVKMIRAEHQWNKDFTVDVEPTADKAGSKSIHCAVCDAKKDITEIPATGKNKTSSSNTKTGIESSNNQLQWLSVAMIILALLGMGGLGFYHIKKNQ